MSCIRIARIGFVMFIMTWAMYPARLIPAKESGEKDPVRSSELGNKIMACYFTQGRYVQASSIPPHLCTHIIYAFGVMSPDGITPMSSHDVKAYRALVSLKRVNPKLKIMISVQREFNSVVDNGDAIMKRFSSSAVTFLKKYNLDGLDLDWEYPNLNQKRSFSRFIEILSTSLHKSGLLMSMALPNSPIKFHGFNASALHRNVDFMTAMTYDFHVYLKDKDNTTGYHSPLFNPPHESKYYSTAGILEYYLDSGLPASKLLVGIPMYGRSWTLQKPTVHGLHSPAIGKGPPAPRSHLRGLYLYADVCLSVKQGGERVIDNTSDAEYLYHNVTWVSFESMFTISSKVSWLRRKNFAGVGIWSLQIDDYADQCGQGRLPLLNKLHSLLSV